MPAHFQQQTLVYEDHKDEIEALAHAIDLIGKKDIAEALKVLMARRNYLQDAQRPKLKQYDPREDRPQP